MSDPRTPDRVVKRDGRVVPFEPEKIHHLLFAAGEQIGEPNAFLARELTDGVLHFLRGDPAASPPTTAEVAATVIKVVREFGYPHLARAYEELLNYSRAAANPTAPKAPVPATAAPWPGTDRSFLAVQRRLSADRLRELSIASAWPREFLAAHCQGLLHLTALDAPLEMAATTLGAPAMDGRLGLGIVEALLEARESAASFVALDSPDYFLSGRTGSVAHRVGSFNDELRLAQDLTGLAVILNLNASEPPTWAASGAAGPLFPGESSLDHSDLEALRFELVRQLAADTRSAERVRIFWHVQERGTTLKDKPIAPYLAGSRMVEFVCDRPRRGLILGPGLDRRHPALLAQVGIDLPALVAQLGGGPLERGVFLQKLGSLARFAKSAGHVRQDFLRKHARPATKRGFLLERAQVLVAPVGLESAVRAVLGPDSASPLLRAEFARQVLHAIRQAVENDQPRSLETIVDSPQLACADGFAPTTPAATADAFAGKSTAIGLDDPTMAILQRLRTGAAMQQAAGGGRLVLRLPARQPHAELEELSDVLAMAWQAGVGRLEMVRDSGDELANE